jgi:peptide/nickel transport system ATP-binding protein
MMSDTVAVMHLGDVVEFAPTDELFRRARHPYTQSLIASIPQLRRYDTVHPISGDLPDPHNPPSGCHFHTRCPIGPMVHPDRTICIEEAPEPVVVGSSHLASCHFLGREVLGESENQAGTGDAESATPAAPPESGLRAPDQETSWAQPPIRTSHAPEVK